MACADEAETSGIEAVPAPGWIEAGWTAVLPVSGNLGIFGWGSCRTVTPDARFWRRHPRPDRMALTVPLVKGSGYPSRLACTQCSLP